MSKRITRAQIEFVRRILVRCSKTARENLEQEDAKKGFDRHDFARGHASGSFHSCEWAIRLIDKDILGVDATEAKQEVRVS